MTVFLAIAVMAGIALVLATLLVIASKKLRVYEDPRVDQVEEMLPHANCGACGYPGCRAFAEALVSGKSEPAQCTVGDAASHARVAKLLGVAVGTVEKRVARLACAGGTNVARNRARYTGAMTCAAAAVVGGGGKVCAWGCLGYGDCARACEFDAIRMNENLLPVVNEDKCTACGDCVEACPKDLFSLHPASQRLWVACNSHEFGDQVEQDCEVACTACGRCALDAPTLIRIENNLAVIDYERAHATQVPIQRCPTGAIVWLEADGTVIKGPAAKKVFRREALREVAT